ncbi:MAG: type I 3-dehydroquinate dehydratase [bacterium]|nr:type I 3-dehydroquinate dehydratase [bacterium]
MAIASPPPNASMVEIRADLFDQLDVRRAIAVCPLPVLVTHRSDAEGGSGSTDPETRLEVIRHAYEAGAALIDIEFDRDLGVIDTLGLEPERVVVSWHDTQGTPQDLVDRADAMLACSARWVKMVPTARSIQDSAAVLDLVRATSGSRPRSSRLICMAMGLEGQLTRYLSPLLGAPLMFVAWSADALAAPGQVTADAIESAVGHLRGAPQRLYGVIGENVSQSLSPALHGAAYRAADLPYAMVPISLSNPEEIQLLASPQGPRLLDDIGLPVHGFAVTVPYKQIAASLATIQVPRVERAQAANTLILAQNAVIAENTDADGVVGSLTHRGVELEGKSVLIQGTGGAARGAAVGLDLWGASVILRGRDAERTRTWADRLGVNWCEPDEYPESASILVNATPAGSAAEDSSPFSSDAVDRANAVLDMVYAALPTQLGEMARQSDICFVDGREMLLYQGIAQFAAFTGLPPDRSAMRQTLGLTLS